MTPQDLADATALSPSHLSGIELGLAAITVETVERLARALEVPTMCLVAFPADDERDLIADLICKLPEDERHNLRKDLEQRMAAPPGLAGP